MPRVALLGARTESEELTAAAFRGPTLANSKKHVASKREKRAPLRKIVGTQPTVCFTDRRHLVGVFVPLDGVMLRILAAWNVAGWLYITLLGVMMVRCEVAGIRQQASLEDESRSAILVLTVLASAATMVAVGAQLSGLSKGRGL